MNFVPKKTYIKKNQYDPTAGILYGVGCSLIHLAMFITMFFIKFPDVEKARKIDQNYFETVKKNDTELAQNLLK